MILHHTPRQCVRFSSFCYVSVTFVVVAIATDGRVVVCCAVLCCVMNHDVILLYFIASHVTSFMTTPFHFKCRFYNVYTAHIMIKVYSIDSLSMPNGTYGAVVDAFDTRMCA